MFKVSGKNKYVFILQVCMCEYWTLPIEDQRKNRDRDREWRCDGVTALQFRWRKSNRTTECVWPVSSAKRKSRFRWLCHFDTRDNKNYHNGGFHRIFYKEIFSNSSLLIIKLRSCLRMSLCAVYAHFKVDRTPSSQLSTKQTVSVWTSNSTAYTVTPQGRMNRSEFTEIKFFQLTYVGMVRWDKMLCMSDQ